MIENTTWPSECQDKAKTELVTELKRLHMLTDVFMMLSPYDPDNRIKYTEELSVIFHQLGRCEMIAIVAGNTYVMNHVKTHIDLFTRLLNHIDYTNTRDRLIDQSKTLHSIIFTLSPTGYEGVVSMGEYQSED